jgi:murein DD-endopeptidase MepM/ murein hydrolase activator NlpD
MNLRRQHVLIALVAVATAMTAFAPSRVVADDTVKRDPLALAQDRLDAARAQATEVAEKISATQTDQAQLEAEIAQAEQEVPALEARAESLRVTVKDRAVQLYVGHDQRMDAVLQTDSVVDGARAAHLTGAIANHDRDLAAELKATAQQIQAHEDQLRAQRADLQQTVESLAPLQDLLQKQLAVASTAYDKVKFAVDLQRVASSGADIQTGASRCPVDGFVVFIDDFGVPRSGDTVHEGIDMPALTDTPVVAVVAGVMRHDDGGAGGHGAWLSGVDGFSYYYAHFTHYEGPDRIVAAGDVIGYVGMTGDATGPHLHFEVHPGVPGAAPAVDGYALLLILCVDETAKPLGVTSPASPGGATG